jgi:hypothetical protein
MRIVAGVICVLGLSGTGAQAQGTMPPQGAEMTLEQRRQMADAHEKMAACLRSERPLADCREELMKSCQQAMGTSTCPMMGGMGPKRHPGKRGPPPATPPAQTK